MLQWKIESGTRGSAATYSHLASLADNIPLTDGVEALLLRVLETFPKDECADWNTIIISKRPDSGRIIAFPGRDGRFIRDRHVVIWIKSEALERDWYSSIVGAASDDGEVAARQQQLMAQLGQVMHETMQRASVHQAIEKLKERRWFDVVEIEFDDLETVTKLPV